MARFTRSSASEHPPSTAPKSPSTGSKKRKRANSPNNELDEQPTGKVQRTQSPPVPSVGDVPIKSEQSQKILDILQVIDSQGLLDWVFPLTSSECLISLRTLLQESSNHTLSELRSAVQHLFPVSLRNSRSRPSKPASQQQAFCNLALSLLDQASVQSVEIPGDLETIIPDVYPPDQTSSSTSHIHKKPRYALLQHLPSGDYWTSLSSETSLSELKALPKGFSELVSILPSPYPSTSTSNIPTLGSYHKGVLPASKNKAPPARQVSSGSFLDYGIYASFAPSFDQESEELGRQELGQILYTRRTKAQKAKQLKRLTAEREKERLTRSNSPMAEDEVQEIKPAVDVDTELEELLPPDQVEAIKSGLGSLELEFAVSELLDRNKRALRRLQELQIERLMADGGGSSRPQEGSEEWDTGTILVLSSDLAYYLDMYLTAQAVLDSLTTLASLRPRSSKDENAPLIPPPAVLHALHRTLPLSPSPGWYGNLPPGRTTVLRDDSTMKVKPNAPVPAATSTPAPTPTPTGTTIPAISNTGYAGYSYAAYSGTPAAAQQNTQQNQYRTGTANTYMYKPPTASGATSYYPNSYAYQQMYAQSGQTGYTPASGAGTTAYSSWFSSYAPPNTATMALTPTPTANGSGSGGRSTPATPQFAPSYSSFFNNGPSLAPAAAAATANWSAGGTQARTPAVANTVLNSKPGQWNASSSVASPYSANTSSTAMTPTLPSHLRGQTQGQSHTPTHNGVEQLGKLGQQSNFYGYQPGTTTVPFTPTASTSTK
ncbi:hypothetical protein J3R30DRAFT_3696878 [Lentinula aciculospora]|uniref:Uncharacterized protein n=1 Tax=Lentinula aciculospora TaxID=153920 RepID=A0A9W9APV8_9AGAR|nr:hypothetical protein J3R30DRAFT_3696878 [Lentinula aciculospora]